MNMATKHAKCMMELMDAVEVRHKRKAREKEAKDTDIAVAYASCMVELMNGVVVKHSKQDAVKRYENLISEAVEAQGRNDAAKVYSCYKSLRPRKARPLNLVRKPDGENAKTPLEARKVWQGHWAKAVEAVIVEPSQIEEEARRKGRDQWRKKQEDEREILPTLKETERIFRRQTPNKAGGEDGIPPDAYHWCAKAMAQCWQPLLTKVALGAGEPATWTGGTLIELYKGKGSVTDPANSRGITLGDSAGKAWHKMLTNRVEKKTESILQDSQFGARKGRSSEDANMLVRLSQQIALEEGVNHAIIFLDLKSAFDTLPRELTYDALRKAGVSGGLLDAVIETHEQSWFSTEGLETVCSPKRGVKAGDPFGTVSWNAMLGIVIKAITEKLKEEGIEVEVEEVRSVLKEREDGEEKEEGRTHSDCNSTFVDDIAFFFKDEDGDNLMRSVEVGISVVHELMESAGLTVNYAKGKTEALVEFRGKGSRATKIKYLSGAEPNVEFKANGKDYSLKLTPDYKHLGSYVQQGGGLAKETRVRGGQGRTARQDKKRLKENTSRLTKEGRP